MSAARLEFGVAQGRTRLLRQHVRYPLHITRPFHLDAKRPDIATLYLQSCSGGLYNGENISLTVLAGRGAAVEITTQGASLVHESRDKGSVMASYLHLAAESTLIYVPEVMILYPGAVVKNILHVTMPVDAVAVCQEGFAYHDPQNVDRRFMRYDTETVVKNPQGEVLVAERGHIEGRHLGTPCSPLGPFNAAGSVLLLNARLSDSEGLRNSIDDANCVCGISALPNHVGTAIRLLSTGSGSLARGLKLASAACFEAALGIPQSPRHK